MKKLSSYIQENKTIIVYIKLISQTTMCSQEQKEWTRNLVKMITPRSYPSPSPYQRSLCYKKGVEHALEDDGKILFNLPETPEYPSAPNLSTILYSRSKVWEEQMYKDLNRHYVISPEHKRHVKSFASLMRRYRKEYRKHYLLNCTKHQARRKITHDILHEETQLPKEIINGIVSYT